MPKNWNKMSLREQEQWLSNKLEQLHKEEDSIRKMLATVRGGQAIKIESDPRPDEIAMKEN